MQSIDVNRKPAHPGCRVRMIRRQRRTRRCPRRAQPLLQPA